MLDKKCILIFYSKGVYDSAALALEEEIKTNYKDVHAVAISDDEVSPWHYSSIRRKSYIFCARNIPMINKLSYAVRQLYSIRAIKKSKKDYKAFNKPTSGFNKWVYNIRIKYRRIYNAMLRFDPEVVICTTPELLAKVNKAKFQLASINMSVCALITDYQLDKRFVHYKTDGYFVPNDGVKQALLKYNIDEDSITVVNMPISQSVSRKHDREAILDKYNIAKDKLNILFIGGRYGAAAIKDAFMRLTDLTVEYNLIILAGECDGLAKYCGYIAGSKNVTDNVYIVDKVEDMSELYSIADNIICTPTAYVTYEAIWHNIKLILLKGVDNLEKLNAHYLITNSLALQGINADEILASLDKYVNDSEFNAAVGAAQTSYINQVGTSNLSEMVYRIDCLLAEEKASAEHKRQMILGGGNILDSSASKTKAIK